MTTRITRRGRKSRTVRGQRQNRARLVNPDEQTGGTAARREKKANAAGKPGRLSDAQIAEVMGILSGVESVELKLTVGADSHRATVAGLAIDPVESEPRQVYFFDTPDLALNEAGIVVRARRIQGGAADTVIKLRPIVPAEIPADLRRTEACKIELDVIPGGFVCSASFKGKSDGEEVNQAVGGDIPLGAIFSKEQRAFYRRHAPSGIDLDDLAVLGPTFILRSKFWIKKLDRRATAELWLYQDGSRVLELSVKAEPKEAFQVAAGFRAFLARRGIDVDAAGQATKTSTALEFFAKRALAEKDGK